MSSTLTQVPPPSSGIVGPAGSVTAPVVDSDLPNEKTLLHAAKLSMEHDKPIQLDYYRETKLQVAFLGEDKVTKDKILVKSEDEYTSLIQRIFKVKDDLIVMTENTIYIVSGAIKKKEISGGSA